MSFQRYQTYKPSGVGWLSLKFRYAFAESQEKIETEVVGPMLSVSGYRGIEVKDYDDDNRRRADEDLAGYRIVRPGQLVVNTMWLNYGGLGVSEHEGHVSPAYRAYFIKPILDGRYAHHLMRSAAYVAAYTQLLTGVRPNSLQMSRDDLMSFPILVPPLDEQRAIAAFLDRETTKIDALVAEQERLIELLKEKRQAVISHAVTKGLNPDVALKDSGIEHLGAVPSTWEVVGLTKYLQSVVDYRGRTPTKVEDGVFLVTARNIRNGAIDYSASEEYIAGEEYEAVMSRGKPCVGDVLFTTEAPLGQVANVDRTDIALAQRIIKFRGESARLDNYFLKYWLMGSFSQADMEQLATGSTALGIKGSKVGQLRLCLPPLFEQRAIVAYLDRALNQMDKLANESRCALELLQERRTALISAAVTGQIDVRPESMRTAA